MQFDSFISQNERTVSILIIGDIDKWWGVGKYDVLAALRGRDIDHIDVYINSCGGDVADGLAIHEMLKGHKASVTAHLFTECCSIATIIACAADKVVMSKQCLYMIHDVSGRAWGTSREIRKTADVIDHYQNILTDVYVRKTGIGKDEIVAMMNEETFMGWEQAQQLGFVDEVVDAISIDFNVETTYGGYWLEGNLMHNSYQSALQNYKEKGFKKFNINNMSKKKGFWNKVASALVVAGLLKEDETDKAVEALKNSNEIDIQSQIDEAIEGFKPTNVADIIALVNTASDEDKSQLRGLFATGTTDLVNRLQKAEKTITNLSNQIASNLQGSGKSDNNGEGLGEKEAEGEEKKLTSFAKNMYLRAYREGSINAEDFKKYTGENAPTR